MIFGTRTKHKFDDTETNATGGDEGSRGRGKRRGKPLYRYGADRTDVYSDPRVWKGTGTEIETVWFPLEGNSDGSVKKRVVWGDEEQGELSYGKEAKFFVDEPRHAHC